MENGDAVNYIRASIRPAAMRRICRQAAQTLAARRHTWILTGLGFVSLLWFLVRVVPKPSRAAYPCQRAAFPIASGFVLWVLGLAGSFIVFRRAGRRLRQARYTSAVVSLGGATLVLVGSVMLSPTPAAPFESRPCNGQG